MKRTCKRGHYLGRADISVTSTILLELVQKEAGRSGAWAVLRPDTITQKTGLTRHQQTAARRHLVELDVLQQSRRGEDQWCAFRIVPDRYAYLMQRETARVTAP
jgi:hypothetical protein